MNYCWMRVESLLFGTLYITDVILSMLTWCCIQWSWNLVSQQTSWFQKHPNFKLCQMDWLKRQAIPKHEQKCECNRHTVIFYVKRVGISAVIFNFNF